MFFNVFQVFLPLLFSLLGLSCFWSARLKACCVRPVLQPNSRWFRSPRQQIQALFPSSVLRWSTFARFQTTAGSEPAVFLSLVTARLGLPGFF